MAVTLATLFLVILVIPSDQLKIPPHKEVARMARFVVNQCDWASIATISTRDPVKGQPFSNAFSISDGPVGYGDGVPYMYLTHMEISVQDLEVNPQASLSMSLAQTSFCKDQGYDPQSPLCAHIILSGSVVEVNGTEAAVAKKYLFSRHPEMIGWPADHNWFFAKMNITQVWVLDYFGGVKKVTPEDYFKATPFKRHHSEACLGSRPRVTERALSGSHVVVGEVERLHHQVERSSEPLPVSRRREGIKEPEASVSPATQLLQEVSPPSHQRIAPETARRSCLPRATAHA